MSVLLQYEFSVVGLQKVGQAFKSVERMAAEEARNEVRTRDRMARSARPAAARASRSAVDTEAKAAAQLDKQRSSALWKQHQDRIRTDRAAHQERIRHIDKERREAVAASRAADRVRKATIGGYASTALRSTVGIGKAVLGATGIAGGAVVASRIGPGIDLEHRQREVLRAGRLAGQGYAMSPDELRTKVSATAIQTGASQEDLTAGLASFVSKTGDLKGATENLQAFATVAMATGTTVEDIGSAAADLSEKFDIKTTEGMADALSILAMQGKKGAFELKQMAAEFPELASAAARSGMSGTGGVKTLGGLIQIATRGAGKGQATTSLIDAFAELTAHAKDLEGGSLGSKVNVFEKGKGIGHGEVQRNFPDVIREVISAAHGDQTKLNPIFGLRGIKAISPLLTAYNQASIGAGGGKAGDQAGKAAIDAMIADNVEAGGTFKEIQIDAGNALKDTSAQLEILNTKMTDAVRAKLMPALIDLIPKLEPLIPKFGELLDVLAKWLGWLSENPATGLGIAITGAILKDLAMAGIGPAVASTITGLIAGVRGAQAAGAVASGLAGLGGTAAAGGGLLATAGAAARGGLSGAAEGMGPLGAGVAAVGGLGAAYASNEHLKSATGGLGIFDLLGGLLSGKGGFAKQVDDKQNADAREAAKSLQDAAAALKGAAGAMQPGAPPTPGAAPNRGADPTPARL